MYSIICMQLVLPTMIHLVLSNQRLIVLEIHGYVRMYTYTLPKNVFLEI